MAYGDFNYLPRRTASDKALCNKAFNIARNLKDEADQCKLASTDYKFFDKKSSNQQLAEELHEQLENLKNWKFLKTHVFKIKFGLLILQIWN